MDHSKKSRIASPPSCLFSQAFIFIFCWWVRPLDSRCLARYDIVQAKYLPKSGWLSKLFLSGTEVVIDYFCLLHFWCCIYTSPHAFSLDSFFQDQSPAFSSITVFFGARYQHLSIFSSAYESHWLNFAKFVPANSYIWTSHVSKMKSLYVNKQSV